MRRERMADDRKRCGNCCYYEYGKCKKEAPQVMACGELRLDTQTAWPEVDKYGDWCGQWKEGKA
jgi:hypothetical protein